MSNVVSLKQQYEGRLNDVKLIRGNDLLDIRAKCFPIDTLTYVCPETEKTATRGYESLPSDGDHIIMVRNGNTKSFPTKIVGSGYKVIQHCEVFEAVNNAIAAQVRPEFYKEAFVKTYIDKRGASIVREYRFPSMKLNVPTDKQRSASAYFRAIVQNSHGFGSIKLYSGLIDMFCINGMIIGTNINMDARRHTSGANTEIFEEALKRAITVFYKESDRIARLQDIAIPDRLDVTKLFEDCGLSNRRATAMTYQFLEHERQDRGNNAWGLVSALTSNSSWPVLTENQLRNEGSTLLRRQEQIQSALNSRAWNQFIKEAA